MIHPPLSVIATDGSGGGGGDGAKPQTQLPLLQASFIPPAPSSGNVSIASSTATGKTTSAVPPPPPPASSDLSHRAVHKIRLAHLSHNFEQVESAANHQKCSVIVVVKADGYGHGAIQSALHLADDVAADAFAVATLEEGIALRKAFQQQKAAIAREQMMLNNQKTAKAQQAHQAQHQLPGSNGVPSAPGSRNPTPPPTPHVSSLFQDPAATTSTPSPPGLPTVMVVPKPPLQLSEQTPMPQQQQQLQQPIVPPRRPHRRPAHVRILVLGPPVGFPRCFDDYYHHNIECMVSGPEVVASLKEWVWNHKERKLNEIERAANETKEALAKAPLKPPSLPPKKALLPPTGLPKAPQGGLGGPSTGGVPSTTTIGTGGTTGAAKNSNNNSGGTSLLNGLEQQLQELQPQQQQLDDPLSSSSVVPNHRKMPSATLGNVSGHDLAKEVRAILLNQRAAAETKAAEEEERQEELHRQKQQQEQQHVQMVVDSSSTMSIAGTAVSALSTNSSIATPPPPSLTNTATTTPFVQENSTVTTQAATTTNSTAGTAATTTKPQVFLGIEEAAMHSRTRHKVVTAANKASSFSSSNDGGNGGDDPTPRISNIDALEDEAGDMSTLPLEIGRSSSSSSSSPPSRTSSIGGGGVGVGGSSIASVSGVASGVTVTTTTTTTVTTTTTSSGGAVNNYNNTTTTTGGNAPMKTTSTSTTTTTVIPKLPAPSRKRLRWHCLVDSGMGRLGFRTDDNSALLSAATQNKNLAFGNGTSNNNTAGVSGTGGPPRDIVVEILKELVDMETISDCPIEFYGMCTHMADANNPNTPNYTISQMDKFKNLLNRVRAAGISVPTVSTDNSAALLTKTLNHFDPNQLLKQTEFFPGTTDTRGFVRTGGAIYGQRPAFTQLRPVSTLMASVRHVAILQEGDSVGYDRAYIAPHAVRIATLTIGFADGYPRELGNGKGQVSIRGHLFATAGNVCMDMLMVNLGPVTPAATTTTTTTNTTTNMTPNKETTTDSEKDEKGQQQSQQQPAVAVDAGAQIVVGDTAVLWGPSDYDYEMTNGEGLVRLQDIASKLKTTQSALTCGLDKIRVARIYE